ncbi:DMT family transporter [Patescibacteria group bacterium]|nr:DMT family transporter [Patescibacteria group bacterium]
MNWFTFALLAGFFFAASRVASRVLLRKHGNALAFTAIHDFMAGLFLVPFIFSGLHWPTQSITWLYFAGIVIFAFLADWLAFVALKIIDVSLNQIINQIRHVLILVGGLIIFSEAITWAKVIAVVLIIIGVFIALFEKSKIKINKGIILSALSTLTAVIAFHFAKATVADFSETATASFELMLIGVLSFGLLRFNPRKISQEIKLHKWGIVISGILFGAFEALLFFALKLGEASRVIPVTQSALIFALLAGVLFLGERSRLLQKILGTGLIVVGIIIIYIF